MSLRVLQIGTGSFKKVQGVVHGSLGRGPRVTERVLGVIENVTVVFTCHM